MIKQYCFLESLVKIILKTFILSIMKYFIVITLLIKVFYILEEFHLHFKQDVNDKNKPNGGYLWRITISYY